MKKDTSILLIISGGIAAYKALEFIRLARKDGCHVRCILTKGGAQFVTPMSVAALSEEQVFTDLWSLKDETEMGHIRLSREADLILVAPASADIIAKTAHGFADDLATTTLLAADKPVFMAPAMNHMMWKNPATQDNIQMLQARGVTIIGPEEGDMACGEYGPGRLSDPETILSSLKKNSSSAVLKGLKALVTSGPTFEPIDPVRFLGNRSSGKQGHAIAAALAAYGAEVTLVSGPVGIDDPRGVKTIHVETAAEMMVACESALPADIAVCAAAVSDWTVQSSANQKLKKRDDQTPPELALTETPDILATIAQHKTSRPELVIGFAAETQDLIKAAKAKLKSKKCDWIVANEVAGPEKKAFGRDENHVYLITNKGEDEWPLMSKKDVAERLCQSIISTISKKRLAA